MNIWDLDNQKLKFAAKEILKENKKWPSHLVEIAVYNKTKTEKLLLKSLRSNRFLVQVYDEGEYIRLSVNRCAVDLANRRWVDGITWDELQEIKEECGYGSHDALEIYPAQEALVNVANIRHLWVKKEGFIELAWRNK